MFNFTWQGSLIHFSPAQRALDGDRAKPDCQGTTLVSASPIENIANWNAAGERRDCASTYLSINARLWTKYSGTRSLPIIYLLPQRMHQIQKYFSTRLTSCYIAKKGDAIRPRLKDGACVQFCRLFIATIISKLSTCSTHSSEANREPYHVGFAEFRVMSEKEIATFVDTIGKKMLWSWSYTGVHSK